MSSLVGKRRAWARLGLAGALLLLAAACSSQPSPPDMPPFAGTAEYLDMHERARKMLLAQAEMREAEEEGFREGQAQRGRRYLRQMALAQERMRLEEEYKQRERERYARIRAERAQRNYARYVESLQRKEALQREQETAREGVGRRADSSNWIEYQARSAARQD